MARARLAILLMLVSSPVTADTSQPLLGARATALAGAFTAVADDASSFHWNPAGLVYGPVVRAAFFGGGAFRDRDRFIERLRAESGGGDAVLESDRAAGFSVAMTVLGVAFTRFTHTRSFLEEGRLHSEALETSDLALSFVRSLPLDELTVGVNVHFIWGEGFEQSAPAAAVPFAERNVKDVVHRATDGTGRSGFEPDLDLGILYRPIDWARVGVMVRNVTRPAFETPGELPFYLERHGRLGVAFLPSSSSLVSFDVDLGARKDLVSGEDFRELAAGMEKTWAGDRLALRGGVRFETGSGPTRPGYAGGVSVTVKWATLELSGITGTRRRQGALWFAITFGR